jgi:hypothetical protein
MIVPVRSAFNVKARYIAPVSRCRNPSRSAHNRAVVLLPEPAGPSIARTKPRWCFIEGTISKNRPLSSRHSQARLTLLPRSDLKSDAAMHAVMYTTKFRHKDTELRLRLRRGLHAELNRELRRNLNPDLNPELLRALLAKLYPPLLETFLASLLGLILGNKLWQLNNLTYGDLYRSTQPTRQPVDRGVGDGIVVPRPADTIRCGADLIPRVYVRLIRILITRILSPVPVSSALCAHYS